MTTVQQLAVQMSEAFTSDENQDGDTFFYLKDGSPEWMTTAIRDVHNGMLPDDFVYETIRDCAIVLSECAEDDGEDALYEAIQEGMEPEYRTQQLYQWALQFSEFIDEALSDFGAYEVKDSGDLFDIFQIAQKCHIEFIGYALIRALSRYAGYLDGRDGDSSQNGDRTGTEHL